MNRQSRRAALIASVALIAGPAIAVPTAALAQDEGAAPTPEREVIIVTAQRRSENLQDVPITVTTFGAETIEEARIFEVQDIVRLTPGFNFDAFPASQPRLSARGVASSDRGAAGDPSVGVFLDEVYLGRPSMIAFDVFDVERIEVLKGPQGTLYGRNVAGGAVNVIPAAPNLDAVEAAAEVTVGDYERYEGAGFVNLPFADGAAAMRASGSVRTHDGYSDNLTTGGTQDDKETTSGRLQFAGQASETLLFKLSVDGTRDRANGPAQHVVALDETDPLSFFWAVDDTRDTTEAEYDGVQNRDTWGARGQVLWDLPFATVNYILGYRDVDYEADYDLDGGPRDASRISVGGANIEQSDMTSHELRFMSPDGSPFTWVAGVYAYDADTTRDDTLDLALPDFDGVFDFSDGGTEGLLLTEIYHQAAEVSSRAVYADATIPITDKLNVTAGVRYTDDEKTYSVDNLDSDATFRGDGAIDATSTASWDATTWRAGFDYHFADEHMAYFMASRGFKSGGFQETPENQLDALTPFDPEYVTQYEAGTRSTFLDGRLVWNNTVYTMEYTDLQVRETSGLNIFTANADATINGYETQFTIDFGQGLGLAGSYAYTDATFDSYVLPSGDYTGNRLTRTPEHKLVLSPSYTHALASGAELRFAADYQHESDIWDDASNAGNEFRDATDFIDARAIYTTADGDWSVSIWGKNLSDELTRTHQATFVGATFASYNPPRTFGATLHWTY